MVHWRYNEGDGIATVGEQVSLFLPGGDRDLGRALAERVAAGAGLADIIAAVGEYTGLPVTELPDFAVVAWSGNQVTVLVRGPVPVQIGVTGGTHVFDGSQVATWRDQTVSDAHWCTVGTVGTDGLDLRGGTVRATGLLGAGEPGHLTGFARQVEAAAERPAPPEPVPPTDQDDTLVMHPGSWPQPGTEQPGSPTDEPVAEVSASADTAEPDAGPAPAADTPADDAAPQVAGAADAAAPEPDEPVAAAGPKTPVPVEPEAAPEPDAAPEQMAEPVTEPEPEPVTEPEPEAEPEPVAEAEVEPAAVASEAPRPTTTGRLCPQGHANPVNRTVCWQCAEPVGGEPTTVPRPPLGTLQVSDGQSLVMDGTIVVGRHPRADPAEPAQLLTVPSAKGEISAVHLVLRVVDWQVFASDVSRNGTVLHRPGQDPCRLPIEVTPLFAQDRLDLGDDMWVLLDGQP